MQNFDFENHFKTVLKKLCGELEREYKEWLEEDYERKLRSNISKKYAAMM